MNYITYTFLCIFSYLLAIFPRRLSIVLGKTFGFFIYYFIPLRINVVRKNLNIVFPNKSKPEIKNIILKTYQHYSVLMFDFIRQASKKNEIANYNLDYKSSKILNSKNGFILMTAHLGNWEVILPIISKLKKMLVVVREQKNSGGDKFFSKARKNKNITLISKKGSKKAMIEAIKNKHVLGLASDQNAKDKGTYIKFFGKPASIPKGAGHFHYLTKCKIVIGFCIINKEYKYDLKLREIHLKDNYEQKDDLIVKINEIYVKALENEILKYPEQYFWFHKKWDKSFYDL